MQRNKLTTSLARFFGCVVFAAATLVLYLTVANASDFNCTQDRIAFRTDSGVVIFQVEIADTPVLREKGLMFRKQLPANTGMLFVYDKPREVSFWMRNTFIPLDMIFMDASGQIKHIYPNAKPHDETPISGAVSGDPMPKRQFILEIAGGEASRLGLEAGQTMAAWVIDQSQAAWPCN